MKAYRTMTGATLPVSKTGYGYSGSVKTATDRAIRDYSVGDTVTIYEITCKAVKKVKIKRVVETLPLGKAKAKKAK